MAAATSKAEASCEPSELNSMEVSWSKLLAGKASWASIILYSASSSSYSVICEAFPKMDEQLGARVESSRVALRDFRLSDVDDLMGWATDEKVARFCSWEPYKSRDEALKFIEEKAIPHPWLKVICVDGKAIGSISVNQGAAFSKCRGELGYVVGSKYWGRGVASQAVRLVLSTVFDDLPELARIEALVEPANLASQRVVEKAGFVKEGLLCKYLTIKGSTRDFYMYRFLVSDLIPRTDGGAGTVGATKSLVNRCIN